MRALCAQVRPHDVFLADETSLNFCMRPDSTPLSQAMAGRVNEKKLLTLLVCANATGTEKFPLMMIGDCARPPSFVKNSGRDWSFDYWSNRNACMTVVLLFDWSQRFDAYVRRTPGRRALLLLDDFPGHGSPLCLPPLQAVRVIFLKGGN